ncbi:MAG: NAD+ synthase, partial [Deltaproteobacteria bacterium]|nr:NAD+ synthase [Deltaproteobacteria bacterium]
MKIGLLQLNYTVGDFQCNIERIREAVQNAADNGAELCIGSELAVWGYPARDLLLNPGLVDAAWQMTHALAKDLEGLPPTIIGIAEPNPQADGKPL